ncbi:MAG: hypothetical protein U5L07_09245 [Desulfobacterales bacterium]|nr:hypothetical protein [Desulfobacterales bacterium]
MMLKKLLDIFGRRPKSRRQLKPAMEGVERIIRTRCPNLILTRKNRASLMDAVHSAMDHVSGLIDQVPGPVECIPDHWNSDPALNALFVNSDAIRKALQASEPLNKFFKQTAAPQCVALLTAAWHEKTIFGTAKEGEIFRRDVPQRAISFADHKFVAPAADLAAAQTGLQKEALTSICRQAFGQTRDLKAWEAELRQQRDLLAFKVNPRSGRAGDKEYAAEKQVLNDIDKKIASIQNELGDSESNFQYILGILYRPQDLIAFKPVSLRLSRLGIVDDDASDDRANELSLARYKIAHMPEQGGIWVIVGREHVAGAELDA